MLNNQGKFWKVNLEVTLCDYKITLGKIGTDSQINVKKHGDALGEAVKQVTKKIKSSPTWYISIRIFIGNRPEGRGIPRKFPEAEGDFRGIRRNEG